MIKECVDIQVAGASSPAHTEARTLASPSSADMTSELHVLGKDRDALGVDGAQ